MPVSLEEKIIKDKFLKLHGDNNINMEPQAGDSYETNKNLPREVYSNIQTLEKNRTISPYKNITSHRPFLGGFIVFGKKILRKCLKWYIDPICEQQTNFNNAVTPVLGKLTEHLGGSISAISTLEKNLSLNNEKIEVLRVEFKEDITNLNEEVKSFDERLKKQLELQSELLENKLRELEEKSFELNKRLDMNASDTQNNKDSLMRLNEILKVDDIIKPSFFEKTSYSQSGEDTILSYIFFVLGFKNEEITYLDLGANHAKEISNTYYFHNKGGKGVLVEANPRLILELSHYRFNDVVLNLLVGDEGGRTTDFYIISGDGLSTPDKEQAEEVCRQNPNLYIEETVKVESETVNNIIGKYFGGKAPLFINVDIEGEDLKILKSIDMDKYRPLVFVIETIEYRPKLSVNIKNTEIARYMESKGYTEYAFTGINSIFINKKYLEELNQEIKL